MVTLFYREFLSFKKGFKLLLCLFFSLFFLSCTSQNQSENELIIYTYSSFQSSWGPGPQLKKGFEATCECTVIFKDVGDAELILKRVRLNKNEPADMVIGLSQYSLQEAQDKVKWLSKIKEPFVWHKSIPKKYVNSKYFYLLDWAPLTFNIHKSTLEKKIKFQTLEDVLKSSLKISIQDPRMSAPGLQLLYWFIDVYGEEKAFKKYKEIINNGAQVFPSWSSAYGLYKKKQFNLTFSYFTSPIYHELNENSKDFEAIHFLEETKYPVHFEYFAILEKTKKIKLTEKFAKYLLSKQGQKIISEYNYMLPSIEGVDLKEPFKRLLKKKLHFLDVSSDLIKRKNILLKKWKYEIQK